MRITNKYKKAMFYLIQALKESGIKLEQINRKFYCIGNISDSSKLKIRPNKIQISFTKDEFNKKDNTYNNIEKYVFQVYLNAPTVVNIKICK